MESQIVELKAALAAMGSRLAEMENASVAARQLQASFNDGDIAWMLVSSAMVLFMSLPGLGLFYCGMVREKNVLTVSQLYRNIRTLLPSIYFNSIANNI